MKKTFIFWLVFAVVVTGLVGGGYALFRRYLHDRDAALGFTAPLVRPPSSAPTRTTKTYTAEELEEARKNGKTPPEMKNNPAQSNAMNDAVQRNLRTLDEINRINQMNQRLMEQQERARRQNRN